MLGFRATWLQTSSTPTRPTIHTECSASSTRLVPPPVADHENGHSWVLSLSHRRSLIESGLGITVPRAPTRELVCSARRGDVESGRLVREARSWTRNPTWDTSLLDAGTVTFGSGRGKSRSRTFHVVTFHTLVVHDPRGNPSPSFRPDLYVNDTVAATHFNLPQPQRAALWPLLVSPVIF